MVVLISVYKSKWTQNSLPCFYFAKADTFIPRGLLDISLWASIASHLSYWADEDVSHFMISQLLSRQRVIKR